jgi:ribosomal-protein-alanine N-acetyltransferase
MIDYFHLPYRIEPMQVNDIDEVMQVERDAFTLPWSASAYRHELTKNETAHYFVVRQQHQVLMPTKRPLLSRLKRHWLWQTLFGVSQPSPTPKLPLPPVLGYGGCLLLVDEVHITTVAIASAWRGRHLGELLLVGLIDKALELHGREVTLEVRVSNMVAQKLYLKYGFAIVGKRKRYYSDNGEDAYIMTTAPIQDAVYREKYEALKAQLWGRLGEIRGDSEAVL